MLLFINSNLLFSQPSLYKSSCTQLRYSVICDSCVISLSVILSYHSCLILSCRIDRDSTDKDFKRMSKIKDL